jgi:hypothetical protein
LIITTPSCGSKTEVAVLQKENDSLKRILVARAKPVTAIKQWYVPKEFETGKYIKIIPTDYTKHVYVDEANSIIKKYETDSLYKGTIYAYTFSADSIKQYLNRHKNVQDIEVFHAKMGDVLTMIITGIDTGGHHVYDTIANRPTVFEHCQPCPTCYTSFNNHAVMGRDRINNLDTLELKH